jgi:tetratricopeptide (TPR) repeat protein
VAGKYINKGDNVSAINHYKKASELNSSDKVSKYGVLISEGRLLVSQGNKNGIWEAIEKFSKASTLYPDNGEPFYWIAISYTKLGDTDFDLILESYEKALSLELDEKQRSEAEKKYEKAKERKKKLDSFWK